MFAPSAARLSAISRPTPRAAPVTKAVLPFSSKSMIALSGLAARPRRLDQAEQPLWCYGKLINLDAKWRQRIADSVRDCGRRSDRPALTQSAEAAERGRRFCFNVDNLYRRNLARRRHQIVDEARSIDLALIVVDDFFIERGADALCNTAVHLTVHDLRVDETAAVFRYGETVNLDFERLGIDFDGRDVRRRRGGAEHRIVGLGGGEFASRFRRQTAHLVIDRACDFAKRHRAIRAGDGNPSIFGDEIGNRRFEQVRCGGKHLLPYCARGECRRAPGKHKTTAGVRAGAARNGGAVAMHDADVLEARAKMIGYDLR